MSVPHTLVTLRDHTAGKHNWARELLSFIAGPLFAHGSFCLFQRWHNAQLLHESQRIPHYPAFRNPRGNECTVPLTPTVPGAIIESRGLADLYDPRTASRGRVLSQRPA